MVVVGAGAAGSATSLKLSSYGIEDIVVCDRAGAIYDGRREEMSPYKEMLAKRTNPGRIKGSISEAMKGADVFLGLSAPNVITPEDIKNMSKEPVVFVLANPEPEIAPEDALPLVGVLATGRSDYPNQINKGKEIQYRTRCHFIYNCVEVCPKEIDIRGHISKLKRLAVKRRLFNL